LSPVKSTIRGVTKFEKNGKTGGNKTKRARHAKTNKKH
jgi:hypothetical protein